MKCSVCGAKHHALGFCSRCYQRHKYAENIEAAREASRLRKRASYQKKPPRRLLSAEEKRERRRAAAVRRRAADPSKAIRKATEYSRRWREKHRQRSRAAKAAWNENNIDRVRKTRRDRERERYANDVEFRIRKNLRNRLRAVLSGRLRTGSAVCDLGCDASTLASHLESMFLPGMTWDNHGRGRGKWNIDHIKPLASFDLTSRKEVLAACHFSNLQPLWHEENMSKSDKTDWKRTVQI